MRSARTVKKVFCKDTNRKNGFAIIFLNNARSVTRFKNASGEVCTYDVYEDTGTVRQVAHANRRRVRRSV